MAVLIFRFSARAQLQAKPLQRTVTTEAGLHGILVMVVSGAQTSTHPMLPSPMLKIPAASFHEGCVDLKARLAMGLRAGIPQVSATS